jgi:hypothetical protein
MTEETTNTTTATTKKIATADEAITYIKNALLTGELNMKDAVDTLGWSFPRIRSKAKTISKKLGGTFTKKSRSIYYIDSNNVAPIVAAAEITEVEESADEA